MKHNVTAAWYCQALALLLSTASLHAATATIDIDAAKAGAKINPHMYGIFLEEINTAVDGGLYAELIRNRGFEDAKAPEGFVLTNRPRNLRGQQIYPDGKAWVNPGGYGTTYNFAVDESLPYWSLIKEGGAQGAMVLDLNNSLNAATPRSCRLEIEDVSGRIGIANEGFWGISVKEGEKYVLSFWARAEDFSGPLVASLDGTDSKAVSDSVKITGIGKDWKQFKTTLTATKTEPKARFVLTAGAKGKVWLDMVSLFPRKTFMNRANGMRPDIAQMIAELKPGFVRFPGGCVVEGATIENAYNWKQSIGPLEQREEIWNVWDYRRTHGMGYYEYLQFCEDLKAEPMFVSFAGQTCIYRSGTNLPMSQMQWVADNFLDALEYANGPADSKWGKLRAEAGHPAPFNMKMLEIGNENVGRAYEDQYALIYPQIKAKHPDVLALACFRQRNSPTEMVDEHYYNSPNWFFNNARMYDQRNRSNPPIYIAEVAVTSNEGGRDKGNLISALAEGAFLMGCERNADHVQMVSYAPLLANVSGRTPLAGAPPAWHGMIYFDSSRVFGTVSYHLWKLFGVNRPTYNVETRVSAGSQPPAVTGAVGVGTWGTSAEFKDLRVEKDGKVLYESDFTKGTEGWRTESGRWSVTNSVYQQSGRGNGLAYVGDDTWSDYTLTVRARKLGGLEGFLVVFGRKGGDKYWWNLGGWGNTQHAIELNQSIVGSGVPGTIETNRWYDLKVELRGQQIRAYLDGKLIHEATSIGVPPLHAIAGRDEATGDLVVKVINAKSEAVTTTLNIKGAGSLGSEAEVTVLTSDRPSDNNSLDNPARVTPVTSKLAITSSQLTREFPPYSFTLLRVKTK